MSPWGWTPQRNQGIWRYGAGWLKPVVAAVPWVTVGLIAVMLHLVAGTLTKAEGTLFELPDAGLSEGEATGMVAFLMPTDHETLLFFDDARYLLGDAASVSAFGDHLKDRVAKAERKSLLVLADRRVPGGELMKLASIAKRSGVPKILFAEKGVEKAE